MQVAKVMLVVSTLIALFLVFGGSLMRYLDAPYYFRSNTTKQCAFIEYVDGSRASCDAYDPNVLYIEKWTK